VANPISASFVEHIHDILIGTFLPFDETIKLGEYRDRGLIESAVGRPFQTAFGEEVWPSLSSKAASLFHALACNHCFFNGNKRTAVIALDIFLTMNQHLLVMTSDEVYLLAKETVQANQQGIPLDDLMNSLSLKIKASMIDVSVLNKSNVRELLGVHHEKVLLYVERMTGFAEHLDKLIDSTHPAV
jgi:death-on-curing protein